MLCVLPAVFISRLPAVSSPQREARSRGGVRVQAVHLPVPRSHLQVAWLTGGRHASPHARSQVHHHAAGQDRNFVSTDTQYGVETRAKWEPQNQV